MTKHRMYQGLDWQPREAGWREAYDQAITLKTDPQDIPMINLFEGIVTKFGAIDSIFVSRTESVIYRAAM